MLFIDWGCSIKVKYSLLREIKMDAIFTIGGIKSKRQVIKIKSVHPTYVGGQYIAELYLYNKLNDNHGLDESIWDEKKGVAYSGNLIAMVFSGSDAITTLAHELLHLHDFGNLRDVGVKNVLDRDNIMYLSADRSNTKLRFRKIPTVITGSDGEWDGNNDMQWDKIHGYSRP